MPTVNVSFNVIGVCKETIIFNDDFQYTEDEIQEMFENGELITSIYEKGEVYHVKDGKLLKVGYVDYSEIDGEYDLFDVERGE